MNLPALVVDQPAPQWQGREDGAGPEHARWHRLITESRQQQVQAGDPVIIGFCSDAGVRRNQGRPGAADGPAALRQALGSLAAHDISRIFDAGDVTVQGDELEAGQQRLRAAVQALISVGARPVVLGGGHETAYGSFTGAHGALRAKGIDRVGVLNLDAHFDLRCAAYRSSGTPFADIAGELKTRGEQFRYAVLGISEPSNTAELFNRAQLLDVAYLLDEHCVSWRLDEVRTFVQGFLDSVDALQLSIDLDVLPASVAPGVSAPAGLGVPLEVILAVCQQVARSGKLAVLEVVELNPRFDIDSRTARCAARLIQSTVRSWKA